MKKNPSTKKRTFVNGVEINNTEPLNQETLNKRPKTEAKRKLELSKERVERYKGSVSKRRVSYYLYTSNKLYERIQFPPPDEKYYDQVDDIYNITLGINSSRNYLHMTIVKRQLNLFD